MIKQSSSQKLMQLKEKRASKYYNSVTLAISGDLRFLI